MRTISFLAFLVLVFIDVSDAIAQSDAALLSHLDSIAGADVAEKRAVASSSLW